MNLPSPRGKHVHESVEIRLGIWREYVFVEERFGIVSFRLPLRSNSKESRSTAAWGRSKTLPPASSEYGMPRADNASVNAAWRGGPPGRLRHLRRPHEDREVGGGKSPYSSALPRYAVPSSVAIRSAIHSASSARLSNHSRRRSWVDPWTRPRDPRRVARVQALRSQTHRQTRRSPASSESCAQACAPLLEDVDR